MIYHAWIIILQSYKGTYHILLPENSKKTLILEKATKDMLKSQYWNDVSQDCYYSCSIQNLFIWLHNLTFKPSMT